MDYCIKNLLEEMESSGRGYDVDRIKEAYEFAAAMHKDQKRRSGEPYVCHPLSVASILISLGMDTDTIIASLLHDVVEDTDCELETIEKKFSPEIALMVDGVTKLSKIQIASKEQEQAENLRKMLLAMNQDVRVIIIKLADRLHNMRTIDALPEQKRRDKAFETMEVYAPIAGRLGIRAMKEELEDISLKYLDPVAYKEIEEALLIRREAREKFLKTIKDRISSRIIDEEGKDPYIEGRVKSIYGIYRKMYIQGKAFEEIYDVYAVRIIVDTVIECYNILGIMHDVFKPIPNRFKDYISTPKSNMYQSLHTTVLSREAVPFEIQIRTWDMHHTAEFGIAAHWKYKEGIKGKDSLEERLAWVRHMLEVQKDSEDAEDILRSIKSDLAPEEVFVFTPKGAVISLPLGATVIDFAYAIHTAVGNKTCGAKVDGRMVSLNYQVKTGEIVEILTSSAAGHGPSRDWFKIVKTSEARNKIRSWFKKERREENIQEGKEEVEREFRRNQIRLSDEDLEKFLLDIAKKQKLNSVEELYAAVGYGGISLTRIIPRIKEEYSKIKKQAALEEPVVVPHKTKSTRGGIVIEGVEGCLVKLARCCNPLPGDDIVGFVTRGSGVSVHKTDCKVVKAISDAEENRGRIVKAWWDGDSREDYLARLNIHATDRQGLLADISVQLSAIHVSIHSLNAKELKGGFAELNIVIGIKNKEHLHNIISRLSKINGVISIDRI